MAQHDSKVRPDSLRVMNWNAQSARKKKDELIDFLSKHDVDVAVITETHLKPNVEFAIVGYHVVRNDRIEYRTSRRTLKEGGGVAILVREARPFRRIEVNTSVIESVGVELELANGKLQLYSVYCPRQCYGLYADGFKSELQVLTRTKGKFCIFGDLNARRTEWGDNEGNRNGDMVFEDVSKDEKYMAKLPTEPTFIAKNRASYLDICLTNLITDDPYTVYELGSDHYPTICDVVRSVSSRQQEDTDREETRAYRESHPSPVLKSIEDVDLGLEVLCQAVETVLRSSVQKIAAEVHTIFFKSTTSNRDVVMETTRYPLKSTGIQTTFNSQRNGLNRHGVTRVLLSMVEKFPKTPSDVLNAVLSELNCDGVIGNTHYPSKSRISVRSAMVAELLEHLKAMRRTQGKVTGRKQACLANTLNSISLHPDQTLFLVKSLEEFRPAIRFSSEQQTDNAQYRHLMNSLEQVDFINRARSPSEAIFTLRQILQKCRKFNVPTYHLFINLRASYATIKRAKLWVIMQKRGCWSEDLIQLIQATVDRMLPGSAIGLKQDDDLCSLLMTFAIDEILRRVNIRTSGTIFANDLQSICYADDVVFIAKDFSVLKRACLNLRKVAIKMGIVIASKNTKYMEASNDVEVTAVKFLDSMFTTDNSYEKEMDHRISAGRLVYDRNLELLKSTGKPTKERVEFYKHQIRSKLLSGHESWILNKNHIKTLEDFECMVLRTIHGPVKTDDGKKTYEATYPVLVRKMLESGIVPLAKIGRLRWAGQVIRMAEDRPARIVALNDPQGKPARGNPPQWIKRVEDDLKRVKCFTDWKNVAKDPVKWGQVLDQATAKLNGSRRK